MKKIHEKIGSITFKVLIFCTAAFIFAMCGSLFSETKFFEKIFAIPFSKFPDWIYPALIISSAAWVAYEWDKEILKFFVVFSNDLSGIFKIIDYIFIAFYWGFTIPLGIISALIAYVLLSPAYLIYLFGYLFGKGIVAANKNS